MTALALCLAAPPEPGDWTFIDKTALGDRTVITFRTAELADRPARPLHNDDAAPAGAKFGSVPLGPGGAFRPGLAWHPDTAAVWLDADADGRYASGERHTLGAGALEVAVRVPFGDGRTEPRTLLVRKRGTTGLAYAVRGYTRGAVTVGG